MRASSGKLFAIAIVGTTGFGCGDNVAGRGDAGDLDASARECSVTFGGNFDETASAVDQCAAVTVAPVAMLTFTIPSVTLVGPLVIGIDAGGTLVPGMYSSATVPSWSASGSRAVSHSSCLLSGGTAVSPQGSFSLAITSAGRELHGSLIAELNVLALVFVNCGAELSERVEVVF